MNAASNSAGLPWSVQSLVVLTGLVLVSLAQSRARVKRKSVTLALGLLWLLALAVAALSSRGPMTIVNSCTQCNSNLKNLSLALEMYASDHQGSYPAELQALSPDYLTDPLFCPAPPPEAASQAALREVPGTALRGLRVPGHD